MSVLRDSTSFYQKGWCRFEHDRALAAWVGGALPAARAAVTASHNARWLRCGGTWFVGVNALPNDACGAIDDSGPLHGAAVDFIGQSLGFSGLDWDCGQVSVCYPGYPQPMPSEPAAAFRYRFERDAAHIDGLLPEGPLRRRHLREYHGFILGVPMVEFSADASPFVVWECSHEIVRAALKARFAGLPPERWGEQDITDAYQQVRQTVFERCGRVTIALGPGEAFIVHRLTLHGVAPWAESANAGPEGRMICYFRPELSSPSVWLSMR